MKDFTHTDVLAVFIGIGLGVLVGICPLPFGTAAAPLTLELAGGPLLVAIFLSRIGRIGHIVWHIPLSANLALRPLGIGLFLACVGLKAGPQFAATLLSSQGLKSVFAGALITLLPLLIVGWISRHFWKSNYLPLCGLLAGSMTDPPALSFANTLTKSDAPAIAYATVYPLTMFLRIIAAQVLVQTLCH